MDETNQSFQIDCHQHKLQTKRYHAYVLGTKTVLVNDAVIDKTVENDNDYSAGEEDTRKQNEEKFIRINNKYGLSTKFMLRYEDCGHAFYPKRGSAQERKCVEYVKAHPSADCGFTIEVKQKNGCPVCGKMLGMSTNELIKMVEGEEVLDFESPKKRAVALCKNLICVVYRLTYNSMYLDGYDATLHFVHNERSLLALPQFLDIVDKKKTREQVLADINAENVKRGSRHVSRLEDFYWP